MSLPRCRPLASPLLCVVLALACGTGDTGSGTQDSATSGLQGDSMANVGSGAPQRVAVLEETPDGVRLLLVDLPSGKQRIIPEVGGEPRQPLLAPNGREVLFRSASTLYWYREALDTVVEVFGQLNPQAATPYAFSPDGARIAAAMQEAVFVVVTADVARGAHDGLRVAMPPGCRVVDLSWSPDGRRLLVLCFPSPGKENAQLFEIDPTAPESANIVKSIYEAPGLTRLLGWRPDGALMIQGSGNTEEVLALSSGRSAQRVSALEEGEHVLAYLPASDEVVSARSSEDQGDPVVLSLSSADGSNRRPWLAEFPRLSDLSFSAGGRWVVFVNRVGSDRAGGDVYFVQTTNGAALLFMRADSASRAYAGPVVWP
jgi:Tol biopolymer transport system component